MGGGGQEGEGAKAEDRRDGMGEGSSEHGGQKEGGNDTQKAGSDGRKLKGELWESAFPAECASRLTSE